MVATLTANPIEVGLWDPNQPGKTRIDWNTDNNNIRGKVFVSINGALPTQVGGGNQGAVTGFINEYGPVELNKTYIFALRRANNNALLAPTVSVTAYDLQQELKKQTAAAILFANQLDPPQAIYGLVVNPGVDTVRISFRTRRPTIPCAASRGAAKRDKSC